MLYVTEAVVAAQRQSALFSLLLLLAHIRARLDRLQQRYPIAQPLLWVMALERMGLDHRLPVAPLIRLAAHSCALPSTVPS